jgi:hypothetical protein
MQQAQHEDIAAATARRPSRYATASHGRLRRPGCRRLRMSGCYERGRSARSDGASASSETFRSAGRGSRRPARLRGPDNQPQVSSTNAESINARSPIARISRGERRRHSRWASSSWVSSPVATQAGVLLVMRDIATGSERQSSRPSGNRCDPVVTGRAMAGRAGRGAALSARAVRLAG